MGRDAHLQLLITWSPDPGLQRFLRCRVILMSRLNSIILLCVTLFISGCADVTSISRNNARDVFLAENEKTYVSIPDDGRYGEQIYTGSGRIVAGVVLSAFSSRMLHVDISDGNESYDQAINSARKGGYRYLIVPKITHWEDRNTAWSGRPSKASISIRIVDVSTGQMIDSVVIDTRSSVVRMTDPSPEDALPKPVQEYVNSLRFN